VLHINDHMSRGLWVRILLVYIFSGLDGLDFSPKSELMLFRTDSVRTPYGLHGLRTDCSDSTRTPHGLARTSTSPCGLRTDSVQSVRSAQGPVGHCKLLFGGRDQINSVVEFEVTGIAGNMPLRPVHHFLHLINTHSLGMIPGATIGLILILDSFQEVLDGSRTCWITLHSPSGCI